MKTALVPKHLLLPFILITSLFTLWGFANAVTDPMVTAFKKVLELSNFKASLVQMAFYGGYFTMAIPASFLIRRYSYKTGITVGLFLYAAGALLFYPAAVTGHFAFFLLGLYILTFGLAFLETTANPYILAMGDKKTATQRLNLAQSFNPLGLLGGLIIAQQFVFKKLQSDDVDFSSLTPSAKEVIRQSDLMVIRDPYVALGLLVILVLIIISMSKMPSYQNLKNHETMWQITKRLVIKRSYFLGVLSQVFYVGAQIMCWTYIYQYAEAKGIDSVTAGNYQFAAFVFFFVGRFICTFLLRYVYSGTLLMFFSVLAILATLGTILTPGILGMYCLIMISFCMSLMFPTIYSLALDGLTEEESKVGAAGLVMAIVGGALMPTFQGMILDIGGTRGDDIIIMGVTEVNFSFVLPAACFVWIGCYGFRALTYNASKS
ncbi:MAG: L-fucose:H+ symporter permease [Flammeovirgaceae bacterium]|jgi:MFS transporter, FHS family, L-fucose permease|nr:L-fucose:H+ symporter permease [Flammeovirgaceae bacterium]|tara:strand:+ start:18952 stop:20250 length:1299 start_codon:yes stop_codon:yes gene_type:complete